VIVIVKWEDITHTDEPWLTLEEASSLETAKMTTVGKIINEREDSIVIAGSWGDDGEVGDVNCIPRAVITLIEPVASIGVETNE
jgi:hypothetical protein